MLAVLVACFVLSAIIPPVQSPDEHSHLERAYRLSKGHLFLESGPTGSGGPVDDGLLRFIELMHGVGTGGRMDSGLVYGILPGIRWAGTESWAQYAGTGYYFPAIYLPQAAALAVGRYLGLPILHSYQLARWLALIGYLLLVAYSIKILRPSFGTVAVLVTPMAVFQAVSSTIDALSLGLCTLCASIFLSLLSKANTNGRRSRAAILCLAVFVLAASRAHALPLTILPFVVAWHARRRGYWLAAFVVLVCVLAWTVYALFAVHDDRVSRDVSTAHILSYYVSRPAEFASLLMQTLQVQWVFYRDTFIGRLGYLDVYLPRLYLALSAVAVLVLAALSTKHVKGQQHEWAARLVLAFCAVASAMLVFVAMAATWTPFPSTVIQGVQGRYFHIPALLLTYAAAGVPVTLNPYIKRICLAILAAYLSASAYVTARSVVDRYWLSSPSYGAPLPARNKWVPINMSSGDVITAQYVAQAGGTLQSIALTLGTYFGTSDGVLSVRTCSSYCTEGKVDVANAIDNGPAYFVLERPLHLDPNAPVRIEFTLTGSRHPVAIWGSSDGAVLRSVQRNGEDVGAVPLFQALIR